MGILWSDEIIQMYLNYDNGYMFLFTSETYRTVHQTRFYCMLNRKYLNMSLKKLNSNEVNLPIHREHFIQMQNTFLYILKS